MLLLVVLCLTATLPGPTMGQAEGSNAPARPNANKTLGDNQISSLQRRQDLLDTRLTNLHTQLNTQKTEVKARLDRMDGRFDGIETRLSDMEEYLKIQVEAIGQKVELALGHANAKQQMGASANKENRTSHIPRDCREAYAMGQTTSGVYRIAPEPNLYMDVLCEQELGGGGWLVFQLRKDGTVDFFRNWIAYKEGFGQLTGEFWFGNHKIHLLTKHHDQQLKVELTSPDGVIRYADYAHFSIENEAQKYKLNVTGYSGGSHPGDSLTYNNGAFFSTRDRDYDTRSSEFCATTRTGAWWYMWCTNANLNGNYTGSSKKGIIWYHWKGSDVSMRGTRMMIRRRS